MKMSLRIKLAAAALGILLVSPGYAREVSDAQGHVSFVDPGEVVHGLPLRKGRRLQARSILSPVQRFAGPLLM
jgi:hypothetical protein